MGSDAAKCLSQGESTTHADIPLTVVREIRKPKRSQKARVPRSRSKPKPSHWLEEPEPALGCPARAPLWRTVAVAGSTLAGGRAPRCVLVPTQTWRKGDEGEKMKRVDETISVQTVCNCRRWFEFPIHTTRPHPHPHHRATVIVTLHFSLSLFACSLSYGDPIMSMSMPAARRGKPKIVSTRLPLSESRSDSDGRSVRPGR
jgi:hypothetical protein